MASKASIPSSAPARIFTTTELEAVAAALTRAHENKPDAMLPEPGQDGDHAEWTLTYKPAAVSFPFLFSV
jgi:hypothetical protein